MLIYTEQRVEEVIEIEIENRYIPGACWWYPTLLFINLTALALVQWCILTPSRFPRLSRDGFGGGASLDDIP